MKGLKNTNSLFTFAASAALVVLLLLSPCSVRNSIQNFLGHQKTEVSNKSKAAVSSPCDASETIQHLQSVKEGQTTPNCGLVAVLPDLISLNKTFEVSLLLPVKKQIGANLSIPFYILYKKLKVAA